MIFFTEVINVLAKGGNSHARALEDNRYRPNDIYRVEIPKFVFR